LKIDSDTHHSTTPYLDSGTLASLRTFLEVYPDLEKIVGPIARYILVLDANIAASDLIHKYKNPYLKHTAIEETVKSSALELCAPIWLDHEMTESTIPQVSEKRGIPETTLRALWVEYRTQIIWDKSLSEPGASENCDGDEKDLPYIKLFEALNADAILSRDKDIANMGGKQVDLEFVFSIQSYARAASYSVGIRIGGTIVTTLSAALLLQLARGLSTLITQLPDWAKFSLLALVCIITVHPNSRERLAKFSKNLGGTVASLWPALESLVELANAKSLEATLSLDKAEKLLHSSRN
jgi:predicted nucleic acid-binding protein